MSKNIDAASVLDRFAPQIRWVTDSVMQSFDLEYHFRDDVRQEAEILVITYAGLLDFRVARFGQLLRWEAEVSGDESRIKSILAYNLRINLAENISRLIHRNGDESMHDSLDRIREAFDSEPQSGPGETFNTAEPPEEPSVNYDDAMAALADPGSRYLRRFVKEFPFLAMQAIGELPISEMRKRSGLTRPQVTYKLKVERDELAVVWEYEDSLFGDWLKTLNRDELKKIRRSGLYDYLMVEVSETITDNGIVYLLRTEGDEDLEDLVEAKTNLFAVGR
jgi:DNA-binding transcriptional ArsR family regulator